MQLLRSHMRELDSVRGLAILLVLFFHGMAPPTQVPLPRAAQLIVDASQYGWVGVHLFFVLSGFLITGILFDKRAESNYYGDFYLRRARRILPALYSTLAALLLARFIGWRFFGLSALFLANCGQLFGVPLQYGPLWSLAVEEHFYFAWPVLVRKWLAPRLMFVLAAIVVLSPVLRAINFSLPARSLDMSPLYTWLNLDGLAIGAILALWLRAPGFSRTSLGRVAMPLLTLGIVLFVVSQRSSFLQAVFSQTGCDLAAAGVLGCAMLVATGPWYRLAENPFLEFLGFISYGLYLVHVLSFAVIDSLFSPRFSSVITILGPTSAMLVRFVLGSGLAIGIAYLSRRSLEEIFLKMNSRAQNRRGIQAGFSRDSRSQPESK